MKTSKTIGLLAASALSVTLFGCTTEEQAPDTVAPNFQPDSGQAPVTEEASWHSFPEGYMVGSHLPRFTFVGYANYADPNLAAGVQAFDMSVFYNPTGTEMYPEGVPFVGAKPKALVLSMASVWCGPCNYEADEVLPDEYALYRPMGGEFVSVLIDSFNPGTPADTTDLYNWANNYLTGWSSNDGHVYPLVLDPGRKVMPLYEPAFPGNLIVRTSDMKIMYRVAGVMDQTFWNIFEQVMDGTYADPPAPAQ